MADAAGVSPNLITRYFGGKDGLFLAATRVEIPVEQSFEIGALVSHDSRLPASAGAEVLLQLVVLPRVVRVPNEVARPVEPLRR